MPFVDEILKHKTISVVGLDKDTGKTECLRYILDRLKSYNRTVALTSIGIDGEGVSQISGNEKPEIELYKNVVFVTSEKHYKQRRLCSEILNISSRHTSLGRLVTARCVAPGKAMFSGPSDTVWLRSLLKELPQFGVENIFVDGALSRLSLSSPAITEAMILATGAAVSANIRTLISKTRFVYSLINLPVFDTKFSEQLLEKDNGLWALHKDGIRDLEIPSVFLLEKHLDKLSSEMDTIFVSGAVTNKMLNLFRMQKNIRKFILVVKDFTKIFVAKESLDAFINAGGKINVLLRPTLKAICVNPVSPDGFVLNSEELRKQLSEVIPIPVYDIKQL